MFKRIHVYALLALFIGITNGCTASPLQVPMLTPSATTRVIDSPTATVPPSETPAPTLTATLTRTPTITATATITLTPTQTSTSTRTPSRTPAYNLPGLHQVNRCGRTTYHYSDSRQVDLSGPYTLTMDLCVTTVLVNKDLTMQFNLEWRLISWDGPLPSRYMYASNDYMSLGDNLGNGYGRIGDSGPVVDDDTLGGKENTYMGWYLFPPAVAGAREFTLFDGMKSVAVTGIILRPGK